MTTTTQAIRAHYLSPSDLPELAAASGPCVSVYVKTFRFGPETTHSARQLAQALDVAAAHLRERGMDEDDVTGYLRAARDMVEDRDFWQNQDHSLALFIDREGTRAFHLGYDVEPQVSVGDVHRLHPVLAALPHSDEFFILAVSQDDVRLIQATTNHAEEVDLGALPEDMRDALPEYGYGREPEQQLMAAAAPRIGNSRGKQMWHGHGGTDELDIQVRRFLQLVGKALNDRIYHNDTRPLVLACVERYRPDIVNATSYPHILRDVIPGTRSKDSVQQLHELAIPLVRDELNDSAERRGEAFAAAQGTGLASTDVDDITRAAREGRVATLLVRPCSTRYGLDTAEDPSDVDVAVHAVLTNGGTVVVDDRATDDAPVCRALYRF